MSRKLIWDLSSEKTDDIYIDTVVDDSIYAPLLFKKLKTNIKIDKLQALQNERPTLRYFI